MKNKIIFLAASQGGHLTEIMTLFGGLSAAPCVLFTEKTQRLGNYPFPVHSYVPVHGVLKKTIQSFFYALYWIWKTKPEWVITTGAECGTAAIIAGKLFGCKTMFIETASRYRTKTMSAKICYPLVDKFYVQHQEALAIYGKKAEYQGGVL